NRRWFFLISLAVILPGVAFFVSAPGLNPGIDFTGGSTIVLDFAESVDLRVVNQSVVKALVNCGAFDSTGALRSQLAAVLDKAIAIGARAQEDRRSGQMGLFAAPEAGGGDGEPVREVLPDVPEWAEAELLANEKAVLGFYVSSHPLAQHSDVLGRYASATTADLAEMEDGQDVLIGGIITSVRNTYIKNGPKAGKKMAHFGIEDLAGTCNCVIFSDDYARDGPYLKSDAIVFLRGRADRRREEPGLRVSQVYPLESALENLTQTVLIRISSTSLDEESLVHLRDICKSHEGACPVYLEILLPGNKRVLVRAAEGLSVKTDAVFIRQVEELLGSDHLVLSGKSIVAG
ncbi:MAG: OB-fold nucleic acid binding domain-containing protein, partial [Phycisphaerae bacterium]|nr:OB-fold nucleic acid binding domain-containing protein [Phycisphaerae bacterium]